eukprot:GFKZ01003564.1.p1 GENE.GFKZ01003564.1~~GFKZ01003564.1.p1  ORF type:complete len:452 (+),score=60.91 GFKZ01003564.1:138-1493(+)
MSNPYEQLLRKPPPTKAPEPAKPSRDARSSQSSVLSKVNKKKPIERPPIRFNVRPRFRFDLPEPPMDLKMLLGRLSTTSYARPDVSQLEKDFRPPANPAGPSHGLRPNLVESSIYKQPVDLSVDDDALLLSVMSGRPGHPTAKLAEIGRRGAQNVGAMPPPSRVVPLSSAPWMRRMSYDEYRGGSTSVSRHKVTIKDEVDAAKKIAYDRKNDPKVRERRRRAMLQSFDAACKIPIHPDRRKSNLKPVQITPVFPDFSELRQKFIVLEFDREDLLKTEGSPRNGSEEIDEGLRTMAAMIVGKGSRVTQSIACYKPSEGTKEKRKRKREEEGDDEDIPEHAKRIRFVEDEVYGKSGEYTIRIGHYGSEVEDGEPTRSCFALADYVSEDSETRVALLSRVLTGWKLSKKPDNPESQLGLDYIGIRRDEPPKPDASDLRPAIAGANVKVKSEENV